MAERGDGKTGEWMDRIREKEGTKRWEKEETEIIDVWKDERKRRPKDGRKR
jgi:hypothetical protein